MASLQSSPRSGAGPGSLGNPSSRRGAAAGVRTRIRTEFSSAAGSRRSPERLPGSSANGRSATVSSAHSASRSAGGRRNAHSPVHGRPKAGAREAASLPASPTPPLGSWDATKGYRRYGPIGTSPAVGRRHSSYLKVAMAWDSQASTARSVNDVANTPRLGAEMRCTRSPDSSQARRARPRQGSQDGQWRGRRQDRQLVKERVFVKWDKPRPEGPGHIEVGTEAELQLSAYAVGSEARPRRGVGTRPGSGSAGSRSVDT